MKRTTIEKIIKAVNAECKENSKKWILLLLDNCASVYCNKLVMLDNNSMVFYYQDGVAIGGVTFRHISSITLHTL